MLFRATENELVRVRNILVMDGTDFLSNGYPLALWIAFCCYFFGQFVARQIPFPRDRVFDSVLIDLNRFHLLPAEASE